MSFSISGTGLPSEAKESLAKGAEQAKTNGLTEESSKALDAVLAGTNAICDALPSEQRCNVSASGHFDSDGSGSAGISIGIPKPE